MVQDLVDSVYNALEFVEDSALWDKLPSYLAPSDRGGVIAVAPAMTQLPALDVGAEVIRSLRKAVDTATTGSSGADALLHYMDAEDVGDYIESEMKRKEKRNKAAYIERMVGAAADMDDEEVKAYLERLERDWDKLNPLARLGRKYGDQIAHPDDEAYWKNLKPWERRCVFAAEGSRRSRKWNALIFAHAPPGAMCAEELPSSCSKDVFKRRGVYCYLGYGQVV